MRIFVANPRRHQAWRPVGRATFLLPPQAQLDQFLWAYFLALGIERHHFLALEDAEMNRISAGEYGPKFGAHPLALLYTLEAAVNGLPEGLRAVVRASNVREDHRGNGTFTWRPAFELNFLMAPNAMPEMG